MNEIVIFAGILMHTIGLLMFAGGEVWISVIMGVAMKSKKPFGQAFFIELMPTLHKVMFTGILLLLIGGLIRMIGTSGFGMPKGILVNTWDTLMVVKHILFIIIVISGLILMFKVSPKFVALAPKTLTDKPSKEFLAAQAKIGKIAPFNFMLTIIIVVISVVLQVV